MSALQAVLGNLQQLGFFDFILPWLFAFAITWGAIKMAGLFKDNDSVAGIIAMVIAFFVTNYTPYGYIGTFFTQFFGESIMVLAGILIALLFLGLIGVTPDKIFAPLGKDSKVAPWLQFIFYLLIILLAVYLFMRAIGYRIGALPVISMNQNVTAVIFAIVVIGIVVWFVTQNK